MKTNEYVHGHDESVLKMHDKRTVANSMAFMIPILKPTYTVLDVGCGPGSITIDLARNYITQGHVVGIEPTEQPLVAARQAATLRDTHNVEFKVGSAFALPFEDNTFDLVYAHQVIQYLPNNVSVLKELLRVVKSGGYIALKEGDTFAQVVYPPCKELELFQQVWQKIVALNGGTALGPRKLHVWAMEAGYEYEHIEISSSCWCLFKDSARTFGEGMAERMCKSNFGESLVKKGLCTPEQVKDITQAWLDWGHSKESLLLLPHVELTYHKP